MRLCDATLPKEARKVAYFCSMKITQDIRAEVLAMGENELAALGFAEAGMAEKSVEFLEGAGSFMWMPRRPDLDYAAVIASAATQPMDRL